MSAEVSFPKLGRSRRIPSVAGTLVAGTALLLIYLAWRTLRPVLPAIILAAAVASLAEPLFQWCVDHLRGRRRMAAWISVMLLLGGVVIPLAALGQWAVGRMAGEIGELTSSLKGGDRSLSETLGPIAPWLRRAGSELGPQVMAAGPTLAGKLAGRLSDFLAEFLAQAGRAVIGLFLFAVALYYFLLDGARWRERALRLAPLPAEDTRLFFRRFHEVSVAVIAGNLGAALAQATAATVGYVIVGIQAPLVWGAASLFAAFVPLVGPVLIWGPVAFLVGLRDGWAVGGGLALYGLAVVGTVDNVVRPLLVKRGLELHPLWLLAAILGGLLAFGFVGLLVGPLVAAFAVSALEVYERRVVYPGTQRRPRSGPQVEKEISA